MISNGDLELLIEGNDGARETLKEYRDLRKLARDVVKSSYEFHTVERGEGYTVDGSALDALKQHLEEA
jgi:hypothetical protein